MQICINVMSISVLCTFAVIEILITTVFDGNRNLNCSNRNGDTNHSKGSWIGDTFRTSAYCDKINLVMLANSDATQTFCREFNWFRKDFDVSY